MEDNLKYSFLYLPIQNQYINSFGGFNNENGNLYSQNRDYLRLSSEWYYFSSNGEIKFEMIKNIPQSQKLAKGWNLFTISPQFYKGGLGFGNCNLEKVYLWESSGQKWLELEATQSKTLAEQLLEAEEYLTGLGRAIKVTDTCTLSKEEQVTAPPAIPN
jgi:hypothetical protein